MGTFGYTINDIFIYHYPANNCPHCNATVCYCRDRICTCVGVFVGVSWIQVYNSLMAYMVQHGCKLDAVTVVKWLCSTQEMEKLV